MIEPKLMTDAQIAGESEDVGKGFGWNDPDVLRLLGHIAAQANTITAVATALTAAGLGTGTSQLAERIIVLAAARDYAATRMLAQAKELVELRADFAAVSGRVIELLLQVAGLEGRLALAVASADEVVPS